MSGNFDDQLDSKVETGLGTRSYLQLYRELYSTLNYSVSSKINCSAPFLQLQRSISATCTSVFRDWLDVNVGHEASKPPKQIPAELRDEYLLKGHCRERFWYWDQSQVEENLKPYDWTPQLVAHFINKTKRRGWRGYFPYGGETVGLYYALQKHNPIGKGLVIGSIRPWVESMCLYFGASSITTVEYHAINSTHPAISYISPLEMARKWRRYAGAFDFAASFSSLEHSGLGRYGDRLDPLGDLREMHKTACLVKPGGLMYLGLPAGPDAIEWNAHRVYGQIRWPLMAAGWTLRAVFDRAAASNTLESSVKVFRRPGRGQVVAVLQNNGP